MSLRNRVIWTEGLFLQPQHLQQERRYHEHRLDQRLAAAVAYGWGFAELTLDPDLLSVGKIGIASARAVFPDGAVLTVPGNDLPPAPLAVGEAMRDEMVYLCLPVQSAGQQEIFLEAGTAQLSRYGVRELDVGDDTSTRVGNTATLQVAPLAPELRFGNDLPEGYLALGVARVVERRSDLRVVVDPGYLPPVLDVACSAGLVGLLNDVQSLLSHRATDLAGRVSAGNTGSTADITDYLVLQLVNRYQPLVAHYLSMTGLHPEAAFETLLSLAGELATFFADARRPPSFATYDHDDLAATFEPVLALIRSGLGQVREQRTLAIALERIRPALYSATITDRSLLDGATFVLGVGADVPAEQIRQQFPGLVKVAAHEDYQQVLAAAEPGIPLTPLPVAPRQIQISAGRAYFEFDRSHALWQGLKKTGGMAIHLGREFPGLELELWAIRS